MPETKKGRERKTSGASIKDTKEEPKLKQTEIPFIVLYEHLKFFAGTNPRPKALKCGYICAFRT